MKHELYRALVAASLIATICFFGNYFSNHPTPVHHPIVIEAVPEATPTKSKSPSVNETSEPETMCVCGDPREVGDESVRQ